MKNSLTLIFAILATPIWAAGESFRDALNDPTVWIMILVGIFLLATLYVVNRAFNMLNEKMLRDQGRWDEKKASEDNLLHTLTAAVPVEREDEVMTDHEYDGIRELDNRLPPWWLWGFYISIVFAVVYLIRFHITGDGKLSHEEYEISMMEAEEAKKAFYERTGGMVDEENVTYLTDAFVLESGKATFMTNCASCHGSDGGGISAPNLTDEYWINGGGIKNIFSTIAHGGRQGTAMIGWGDMELLSPKQIQEVASFIVSIQGTNPANAKPAEGELWVEEETATEDAEIEEETEVATDSTAVVQPEE